MPPRWGRAQRAQIQRAGSLASWVEGSMQETVASVAWRDLFGVYGPAVEQQGSLRTRCRNQAPPHSASDPHLARDPPPANPTTNQHPPNDQQPEPADQAHLAARDAPTEKPPTPQPPAAPMGARKPMTESTGQAPRAAGTQVSSVRGSARAPRGQLLRPPQSRAPELVRRRDVPSDSLPRPLQRHLEAAGHRMSLRDQPPQDAAADCLLVRLCQPHPLC